MLNTAMRGDDPEQFCSAVYIRLATSSRGVDMIAFGEGPMEDFLGQLRGRRAQAAAADLLHAAQRFSDEPGADTPQSSSSGQPPGSDRRTVSAT